MKLYLAIVTEPSCPIYQAPVVHKFSSLCERNSFFDEFRKDMFRRSSGAAGFSTHAQYENGNYILLYCHFVGDSHILERVEAAEIEILVK